MNIKLPKNVKYVNGWLHMNTADGTELCNCNFIPIIERADCTFADETGNPVVQFRLQIDGTPQGHVRQLRLSDFKKTDMENLDIRCQSDGDVKRIPGLMYAVARRQLDRQSVAVLPEFDRTGWSILDGQRVYVAGNRVIGANGFADEASYKIGVGISSLTLEVDPQITEVGAARYMRSVCKLQLDVSDMLVAVLIVGHLFPLFSEAGMTPRFATYLTGPSMMKKTTLAELVFSTYNRSSGVSPQLVNLMSTTSAVHAHVSALNDCCTIVDDLNSSESRGEMRVREERLSEIIRTAGNASPKVKISGKKEVAQLPQGCVVITAEYTLKAFSTMARCLVLHLHKPVENVALACLQKIPEIVSSFLFYFLRWCCGHYDQIVEGLREQFETYRQRDKATSGMERLGDTYLVLECAMGLLRQYMLRVSPDDASSVEDMLAEFKVSVKACRKAQTNELALLRQKEDSNRFSSLVAHLYLSGRLPLVKKKRLAADSVGAEDDEFLYLSLDALVDRAQGCLRDATITDRMITAELRRNLLLSVDKSGRSTKKINGVRLLHVRKERLQEYYKVGQYPSNMGRSRMEEIALERAKSRNGWQI